MRISFNEADLKSINGIDISFDNELMKIGCSSGKSVYPGFAATDPPIAPIPEPMTNLDHLTWAEINRIGADGNARSFFALGAQKKDKMKNGFVAIWQIIGFDHDELADDSGKAPITWDMVSVYRDEWPMNEDDTNEGGWADSLMRKRCNGELFNLLSDELQAVVKTVYKRTSKGLGSSEIVQTMDKVWLKSEKEIFGRCIWSVPGEGNWYEFYRQEDVPYYKVDKDGDCVSTWERSPIYNTASAFCYVNIGGNATSNSSRASRGLAPALCT